MRVRLRVLGLERASRNAGGHVGRCRSTRFRGRAGIRLRPSLELPVLARTIRALARSTGGRIGRRPAIPRRPGAIRALARRATIRGRSVWHGIALDRTVRLGVRTRAIPIRRLALLGRRRTLGIGSRLGRVIPIRRRWLIRAGPSWRRPPRGDAIRTIGLLVPPVLLTLRSLLRSLLGRGSRCCRFWTALGCALARRRLARRRALGRGLRPLARRRCGVFRPGLGSLARGRRAGGRAGALLRRTLRTRAAMRGLAAAGPALVRSALCQQDPARRGTGGLHEREARQHRAGEEDQAEQAHRGLVSVPDEPNTGRHTWFRTDRRGRRLRG
ncbi:hypothetical protein SAMN05216360_10129 [Methylobacterium phyllostachyos]|uniref:Uncharacterized protein n=1 Tax=Methylobacterium phyllostachyos TaxID=582672 RepID=A0A1G9QZV6_9HYPH|nr:hypothetical protein SAMN05216360_10129 [Methylobacterium phyllostachyos]